MVGVQHKTRRKNKRLSCLYTHTHKKKLNRSCYIISRNRLSTGALNNIVALKKKPILEKKRKHKKNTQSIFHFRQIN